jgi:hypothetical protein
MFRFTIRDVLWLTVVAALAIGWLLDQDRIRRQTKALRASEEKYLHAAERLQSMSLERVQKVLAVEEAELASMLDIKQRNPGAVSDHELRRFQAKVEVARLDVEIAEARENLGANASGPNPRPNRVHGGE